MKVSDLAGRRSLREHSVSGEYGSMRQDLTHA
jgi:hypothetical protein